MAKIASHFTKISTKNPSFGTWRHLHHHLCAKSNSKRPAFKMLGTTTLAAFTLLAGSSLFIHPTHAKTVTKYIWSFGEVRYYGEKYLPIVDDECNHDEVCERAKYAEYKASDDPEKIAAAIFNTTPFTLLKLDPYRAEFTYYYNDIATGVDNRDFTYAPGVRYRANHFDNIFYFSDSTSQYTLGMPYIKGRVVDTYLIDSSKIPKGHHVTSMKVDLKALDEQAVGIRNQLVYTSNFEGCLDSDELQPGMVCETYFDSELGTRSRAVHPEDVQFEYSEPEPDSESDADLALSPSAPNLESDASATPPQDNSLYNSSNQPVNNNTQDASIGAQSTLTVSQSQSSDLSPANNLPLAPNTAISTLSTTRGSNIASTATNHNSKLATLTHFMIALVLANILVVFSYIVRKSSRFFKKVPKKS